MMRLHYLIFPKIWMLLSLCMGSSDALYAQSDEGYHIEGQLEHYDQDSIFLGYYYGNKQYLLDTAIVVNGTFEFASEDTLVPGVYLVVMPPDNKFFHLMISDDAAFAFAAAVDSLEATISFEGSVDNQLFYDNLRYIAGKKRMQSDLTKRKEEADTPEKIALVEQEMNDLHVEVTNYQERLVSDHPETLTAAIVKAGFQVHVPAFPNAGEETQTKRYLYYKKHFFDHIDLGDKRLLRSPQHVLYDKVNYYLEKLTPQHPDSIIQSLDYLLMKLEPSHDNFKFFLIKFLNDYAQSKIVGMDAVYVHLALQYYAQGKAPWLEEKQLKKIVSNGREAAPTLIGQTAPNFVVQTHDSVDINLHGIESPFLVLVFWAHDCGHCKETMPELLSFYEEYKSKGVEVLSVCTKINSDEAACWDFIDERNLHGWINASDQMGGRSFMHSLYNIKKTPKLLVLDANKKIISKELNPEQLKTFLDQTIGAGDTVSEN